jgi:hypothetical protein
VTERTPQRVYLDLQKLARDQGRNTQQLFELYIHERFLARVAESQYADKLVLKGGMLLAVLDVRRGTRDADMLARGLAGDESRLKAVIGEIASISMADGVGFDTTAISIATIREGADYECIRPRPAGESRGRRAQAQARSVLWRPGRAGSRSTTRRFSATKAFRSWAIHWRA